MYYYCLGLKRKHNAGNDGVMDSLVKAFEKAEERAAEREERMRIRELEMEEKMREREDRREMQIFSMFTTLIQQMNGPRLPHTPSSFHPSTPYQSTPQQLLPTLMDQVPSMTAFSVSSPPFNPPSSDQLYMHPSQSQPPPHSSP